MKGVDVNVASILIAQDIYPALETNVLILVLEFVEQMHYVKFLIMLRLAIVLKECLAMPFLNVDLIRVCTKNQMVQTLVLILHYPLCSPC